MMRKIAMSCVIAVLAACSGTAQVRSNTVLVERQGIVPAGTPLTIALEEPLSSTYSAVGHVVSGVMVEGLRSPNGELLVPRGSRVYGRVVDRQGYGPRAALWVRIESIEMGGVVQRMRGE